MQYIITKPFHEQLNSHFDLPPLVGDTRKLGGSTRNLLEDR